MWVLVLRWSEGRAKKQKVVWLGAGDTLVGRNSKPSKSIVGVDMNTASSELSRQCLKFTVESTERTSCQLNASRVSVNNDVALERSSLYNSTLEKMSLHEGTRLGDGDVLHVRSHNSRNIVSIAARWQPLYLAVSSELKQDQQSMVSLKKTQKKLSELTLSPVLVCKTISDRVRYYVTPKVPMRLSTTLLDALSFRIPVVTTQFLEDSCNHIEGHKAAIDLIKFKQEFADYIPSTARLSRKFTSQMARRVTASQSQGSFSSIGLASQQSKGVDPGPNFVIDLSVQPSRAKLLNLKIIVIVDQHALSYKNAVRQLGIASLQICTRADEQETLATKLREEHPSDKDATVVVLYGDDKTPPLPCWAGFYSLDCMVLSKAIFANIDAGKMPFQYVPEVLPVNEVEEEREKGAEEDDALFDESADLTQARRASGENTATHNKGGTMTQVSSCSTESEEEPFAKSVGDEPKDISPTGRQTKPAKQSETSRASPRAANESRMGGVATAVATRTLARISTPLQAPVLVKGPARATRGSAKRALPSPRPEIPSKRYRGKSPTGSSASKSDPKISRDEETAPVAESPAETRQVKPSPHVRRKLARKNPLLGSDDESIQESADAKRVEERYGEEQQFIENDDSDSAYDPELVDDQFHESDNDSSNGIKVRRSKPAPFKAKEKGIAPKARIRAELGYTSESRWMTDRGDLEPEEKARIHKLLEDLAKRRKREEKRRKQEMGQHRDGDKRKRFRRGKRAPRPVSTQLKWVEMYHFDTGKLAEMKKNAPVQEESDFTFSQQPGLKGKLAFQKRRSKRS